MRTLAEKKKSSQRSTTHLTAGPAQPPLLPTGWRHFPQRGRGLGGRGSHDGAPLVGHRIATLALLELNNI